MPIKLVIEEETEEVIEKSIPVLFEELISNDDTVITIKFNIPALPEEALAKLVMEFPLRDIFDYLEFCKVKIKFSSFGLHLNGENKVPHVHLHLITENYTPDKNPSQHRSRWFARLGGRTTFNQLSFKYSKIDPSKAKYSTLSYPLKEGKGLLEEFPDCYKNISAEMYKFLLDVGTSIYNKELGLHLRQDKCEERKKNSLLELNNLLVKNKSNFYDYKSMMTWLDDNYISSLTLTELPDPKHYKTNCQKIAVKFGYIKYSNL